MSQAPLVSVVIPAYNAERTLPDTVRSVLSQSIDDLQVIVVDDGSADRTAEAAGSIPDSRVMIVAQENAGVAAARNTGLAAATGRYVAFVDADDLWLPRKLECQLAVMESDPSIEAVQAGVFFVDDDLRVLSVRRCSPWKDALLDTLMFKNSPAFPSTVVFVRESLVALGGFDPSLVILEDWSLAVEAARHCNLSNVEAPLALYRVHAGNRSQDLGLHVMPGHRVLDRVFSDPNLPPHVRAREREVYAVFYTMLAGGAFRNRQWGEWLKWTRKALALSPRSLSYMGALPLRQAQRRLSRSGRAVRGFSWAPDGLQGVTPVGGGGSAATVAVDAAGNAFRLVPIQCPICTTDDTKLLGWRGGQWQREGLGVATPIVRCRTCGLLYPNPFPYPEDSNALYRDLEAYFVHHDEEAKVEGYRDLLRGLIASSDVENPSFLDVGCGRGEALEAARLEGIDDAVGLEFADAMVAHARERYDANVVTGTIEEYDPGRTFDIVLLGAIVQHVHDPVSFIRGVARLTRPGSVMFLDTPGEPNLTTMVGNLANRLRRSPAVYNLAPTWMPYHVFGFNPKAIRALLESNGFEVERILMAHNNPQISPGAGLRGRVSAWLGTQIIRLGNHTPWASNMAVWARRR